MNIQTQLKSDPASFGGGGGDILTGTGSGAGPYYALKALGDVVINTATLPPGWTVNGLNGATISDGDTLILPGVTKLTLTSGTLVCYKATNKQVSP